MKALTFWRPWPYAIFHLPPAIAKRVENRSWKPPAWLIGQRIAIHAGKTWDPSGASECIKRLTPGLTGDMRAEGIVGTALLVGFLDIGDYGQPPFQPWFRGPFGWLLDDVRPLPEPIPCQGRQGLWDVPADLVGRLG